MSEFKKGDIVYFSSVTRLINEGVVMSVDEPYIMIRSNVPSINWITKRQAFHTKEELRRSNTYRVMQTGHRVNSESFGRILSMQIF